MGAQGWFCHEERVPIPLYQAVRAEAGLGAGGGRFGGWKWEFPGDGFSFFQKVGGGRGLMPSIAGPLAGSGRTWTEASTGLMEALQPG